MSNASGTLILGGPLPKRLPSHISMAPEEADLPTPEISFWEEEGHVESAISSYQDLRTETSAEMAKMQKALGFGLWALESI